MNQNSDWRPSGPTLDPKHHQTFLDAVLAFQAKAPSRKPEGRDFQANDVVTLKKPGASRRYVVSDDEGGKLTLVALSGSCRTSLARVSQEAVSLDPDQEIFFRGADSGKLQRDYQHRVGNQAYRGQP